MSILKKLFASNSDSPFMTWPISQTSDLVLEQITDNPRGQWFLANKSNNNRVEIPTHDIPDLINNIQAIMSYFEPERKLSNEVHSEKYSSNDYLEDEEIDLIKEDFLSQIKSIIRDSEQSISLEYEEGIQQFIDKSLKQNTNLFQPIGSKMEEVICVQIERLKLKISQAGGSLNTESQKEINKIIASVNLLSYTKELSDLTKKLDSEL